MGPSELARLKQRLRREALARRDRHPDRDAASRTICAKLAALPQYSTAKVVMFYVHFRSEVQTGALLAESLRSGKQVVVPYCQPDRLGLFRLRDLEELAPGTLGIPEPKPALRGLRHRLATPAELDLIVVPGVAFDRRGTRLGHGRGYYDKLLAQVRPDALLAGVAFQCQIFPEIPTAPHDVPMDLVITERAIYHGQRRSAGRAP